jgi:hypothetical protein
MFNKKDPVTMAMYTLVISFILFVGIIYLVDPDWVKVVNQNTGKSTTSWQLVLTFSSTFALVCSIATMLLVSRNRGPQTVASYDVEPFSQNASIASAYSSIQHLA